MAKSSKGIHNTRRNNILLKELENPLARKIKNRYKLIRNVLKQMYPDSLENIPNDKLENIIFDAISLDRKARKETEEEEIDLKEQLSQEWQIHNL